MATNAGLRPATTPAVVAEPTIQPDLKSRLERCSTLPTMPAVAIRVLQLCQSDDLDLAKIAATISTDPALSAKMLRLVNSPVFGLRNEVRTVPHALALLGLNAVRTLALSFSLVRELRKSQQSGLTTYWKRSIISAIASRELGVALRFPAPDEAFLGALLQDIGILALGRTVGREYEGAAEKAGDDHMRLAEAERAAFGADHADVGAWLLGNWKLPEPLRLAVAFSHRSGDDMAASGMHADIARLARIIRLSGSVADIWVRAEAGAATEVVKEEATALVGLTPAQLDSVLTRTAAAIPQVAELFDMKLGTLDEITSILEEAKETLVMVTLRATRQADSAREEMDSLQHKTRVLEEASQRDKLTGLFNRGRFDACLTEEFAIALRNGKPLSVVMADVDHFKRVNDTWGHPAGDKILIAVAESLGGRLRPRDLAARYGGEEFVLILPETDAVGSEVVAERIRKKIEAARHDVGGNEPLAVTASLGCATLVPTQFGTGTDLLAAADQALYAAKRGGRNRVVLHKPAVVVPSAV
ncbi:MAG: GGDEF domain-containing protein [Bacteroidota bacterium]